MYSCHEYLSLLDSRTRANSFLSSQKHVQNNGSQHWYPTNSSSFDMFQSAKRILGAEHARKLPDSGEGDRLIVMHVELSYLIFTLAHTCSEAEGVETWR